MARRRNVTYVHVPGHSDFSVWMVWLFIMCWSAYGVEVCASFAPEYNDTKRDTVARLRTSAIFCLLVFTLLPLGLGGVTGARGDAGAFYVAAFRSIVGSQLGGVALLLLIASLILAMNSATADAGRALFGISREGMTIKELGHLNRHHVPGRGMAVNMVLNCCLILFVANNLAILYLSNIGYVFCHVLALSGFLLLRRDRPDWPRPIKLGPVWVVAAAALMLADLTFLIFGLADQSLVALLGGYQHSGGPFFLGIGILGFGRPSVLLSPGGPGQAADHLPRPRLPEHAERRAGRSASGRGRGMRRSPLTSRHQSDAVLERS